METTAVEKGMSVFLDVSCVTSGRCGKQYCFSSLKYIYLILSNVDKNIISGMYLFSDFFV